MFVKGLSHYLFADVPALMLNVLLAELFADAAYSLLLSILKHLADDTLMYLFPTTKICTKGIIFQVIPGSVSYSSTHSCISCVVGPYPYLVLQNALNNLRKKNYRKGQRGVGLPGGVEQI